MTDPYIVDHVALVTTSIEACIHALGLAEADPEQIEAFPSEGTRELYVGPDGPGRLLLMQPTADAGPYARALTRRGPGLHHLAICVHDLNQAVLALGQLRWLLHPRSVVTMAEAHTAWLCRPGFPGLLEVSTGTTAPGPPYVERLEIPMNAACPPTLLDGFDRVGAAPTPHATVSVAGRTLPLHVVP